MQAHSRRSFLDVHEWSGTFRERPAHFKMTSVIGHVMSVDFPPKYQNWETTDPASLFDAPTIKSESNPKVCRLDTLFVGLCSLPPESYKALSLQRAYCYSVPIKCPANPPYALHVAGACVQASAAGGQRLHPPGAVAGLRSRGREHLL